MNNRKIYDYKLVKKNNEIFFMYEGELYTLDQVATALNAYLVKKAGIKKAVKAKREREKNKKNKR